MLISRLPVCLVLLVLCTSVWSVDALAQEQESSSFYMAAGGESWLTPNTGGQGYFIASYARPKTLGQATFSATLNTDTLELALGGFRLNPSWTLDAVLKGEAVFSGLLPNYFKEGANRPARGFNASFIQGSVIAKYGNAPHFLDFELSVRKWGFFQNSRTSAALQLPPNTSVFEPRIRYTYWLLDYDEATNAPHRHYWRVRGLAFGAQAGVDVRTQTGPWGARDSNAFVVDERNTSQRVSAMGNLWTRAGVRLAKPLRLQGTLSYTHGYQLDDLNRVRVGGMNPYVQQVSGMPWASLLPNNVLSTEMSLHTKVLQNSEVGLMAQSAWMTKADLRRTTENELDEAAEIGVIAGLGLFGDFRFDSWQVDTRLGWALPSSYLEENPHFSVWLSVGKQMW